MASSKYLPERRSLETPLPKIFPVNSLAATLEHFEHESVLRSSSLSTKNSRWNTFVSFCSLRQIDKKSIFPEDLLAFATWLLETHTVQKTDDYIVAARQRLLSMRRMETNEGSKEFFDEVARGRIKLANKNYNPSSAPPLSEFQVRTFLSRNPSCRPLVDFWLFTGFRISSFTSEALSIEVDEANYWSFVSTQSKSQFDPNTADWRYVPTHLCKKIKPMLPLDRQKLDSSIVSHLGGKSHSFRRTVALAIRQRADQLKTPIVSIQHKINQVLGWSMATDKSFKHYTRDAFTFASRRFPVSEELLEFVFRKEPAPSAASNKSSIKKVRKPRK